MSRVSTKYIIIISVVLGILFLGTSLLLAKEAHAPQPSQGVCVSRSLQPADSSCILLEYADTPDQQTKGLGGRVSLAQDRGMLFRFSGTAVRCIWMEDMQFPIDIVWLDGNKTIVAKRENVSPDTYPETFCPDKPARFVIEVNAGIAKDWKIEQPVPF